MQILTTPLKASVAVCISEELVAGGNGGSEHHVHLKHMAGVFTLD